VFQIGRPIGGGPSSDKGSLIVAQTVVSVGPLALIIRRPFNQRAAISDEHASPAVIKVCSPTSSDKLDSKAGGNVACVMHSLLMRSTNLSPTLAAGDKIRAPPAIKVVAISAIAASKLREAN
jgi:hypothetical protein